MNNIEILMNKYQSRVITEAELSELQQLLKQKYYEGTPVISDEQYDNMFNLNTEPIGYSVNKSSWGVAKHLYRMGSLRKIKTYGDAVKWMSDKSDVVIEPKLDGLSICYYYINGVCTSAVLRGDGISGEDIFVNAKKFKGYIENVRPDIKAVRGEIVISLSDFEKIKDEYSNRRNAVAGICRRQDGEFSDLLTFFAYDVQLENAVNNTEINNMQLLYEHKFNVPFVYSELSEQLYLQLADMRLNAEPFQMDGLVLKINDIDTQNRLGLKDMRPLGQIALKFPPVSEGGETVLTGYEWNVGSTGAVIPKALFKTVDLQGSKVSKAAMGSFQQVIEMNMGIGSKILVKKMGDVIPKITDVLERQGVPEIPTACPDCGTTLIRRGANLFCDNPQCPQKLIASCSHFVKALKIKGLGNSFVAKLVKNKVINNPVQVLSLTPDILVKGVQMSVTRASNTVLLIKDALRQLSVNNILNLFLINGISAKAYDIISNYIKDDVLKLFNITKEISIQLLGDSKGTELFEFIQKEKDNILYVYQYKLSLEHS